MKPILFILLVQLTVLPAFSHNCISVEEALKKGMIKLCIKSKGGHMDDAIEMRIQNITNQGLKFKIEAGRILDSQKQREQDILIIQPQEIFVDANKEKKVTVKGMCCQASNGSPTKGALYSIGKMANNLLIKLANFIHENKYYNNYSAQSAVWCISNGSSIGSIYDGDKETDIKLREFVSKLTGRKIPPYKVTFVQQSNGNVIGKAKKIEGVFDYRLAVNAHTTIAVYNSSGKIVQTFMNDKSHEKGDYKLFYIFKTMNLEEGKYYLRATANGVTQKELEIEF
jgi:hypothetical protein